MFLLDELLESAEIEDSSLKTIDPREKSYNSETDNALYKEAYQKAMISIKTAFAERENLFREVSMNVINNNYNINNVVNNNYNIPVKVSQLTINPVFENKIFSWVTTYLNNLISAVEVDGDIILDNFKTWFNNKCKCTTISVTNSSDILSQTNKLTITFPLDLIKPNINSILNNINSVRDDLYLTYDLIGSKILVTNNPAMVEALARIFEYCCRTSSYIVGAYYNSALELHRIVKNCCNGSMTESVDHSENVQKYIDDIDELIDKIREFYDNFKYKEIITPRKKKKHKMVEYVTGALQRKYTLKIPIYKVIGVSSDVKNIVEHQFIDKLESIAKNYPNFIIMSPSWDEETDMYIYITLREPFGDKDDKANRKMQAVNESSYTYDWNNNKSDKYNQIKTELGNIYNRVERITNMNDERMQGKIDELMDKADILKNELRSLNEAALSTKERNVLQDYEFGLPETRNYPLNDEERIRKAIQFFGYCKSQNKTTLANNIVRRIIELNLVGKVNITEKHPNRKYFPDWMLNTVKPKLIRDGNRYDIYVNDEKVDYGTLDDHSSADTPVINENGYLY